MKIELVISRTKQLRKVPFLRLKKAITPRLQNQYENCSNHPSGSQDECGIVGAADGDKTYTEHSAGNVGKKALTTGFINALRLCWRAFFQNIPQFAYPLMLLPTVTASVRIA